MVNTAWAAVFKIRLEPITPVHVWSGEEVVVGLDARVANNRLEIVDLSTAIPQAVRGAPSDLLRQLESGQLLRYAKVVRTIPTRVSLNKRTAVRLLPEYIVPASSLKGYIRTAFL
ncbi:MAG: hypothetical protein ACP5VX_05740, partial [Thermogladius sp.]